MLWLLLTLSPPSFLQHHCDVSAIEAESGFCILTSNVISDTVLGEAEKSSFISLSGKGHPTAANALKTVSRPGGDNEEFYGNDSERPYGNSSGWFAVR